MRRLFLGMVISTILAESKIEMPSETPEKFNQIQTIIAHNRFRVLVIIKTNESDPELLQNLTRLTNQNTTKTLIIDVWEVKTFNGKYHGKFSYDAIYEESCIYVMILNRMSSFPLVVDQVVRVHFWRNRHRTIVSFQDGSITEMEELFRSLWKKRIINTVFLFSGKVFGFNPFRDVYDLVLTTPKVFSDKYRDMHGSLLKMSMFETAMDAIIIKENDYIGRDAFLSKTLALSLNCSYKYIPPRDGITYGMKYPNGSMSGVFADVATFYTDFTMNSRLVKLQFENILEHTYPHDREDLACLVPKSPKQPEYKKFTILFPQTIWIILAVTILAFTILWYFATEIKYREFFRVFFHVFSITLGVPINDQTGFKRRAVLIFYTFYMFLLLAAYHGVLTSVLTVPIALPEINSLSDLENSGLDIIAATRFKDMLQDNQGGSLTTKLINKIKRVPDDPDIDLVIKKRGHYAIILKETFALRATLERDNYSAGKPIYRIMKEKPMPSQVCFAMRYGSPALPRINKLLRRYQENGINEYWKALTIHLVTLMTNYKELLTNDDRVKVLTLDNISASYYVLGLGFGVSLLAFIGELVVFSAQKYLEKIKGGGKQNK